MRYYVVLSGLVQDRPYVVAETVCDPAGEDRELSLAGGIGGALARILTEFELLQEAGGPEAMQAWRGGDDEGYNEHEASMVTSVAGERDPDLKAPVLRLILSPVPAKTPPGD